MAAGGEQQEQQGGQDQQVEADVEDGAVVAEGSGNLVRVGRKPEGADSGPVPPAAEHGAEFEGQWTPGRGVSGDLPQHRPHHELLIDDELAPPATEVEQTDPRSGRTDDEPAADHEQNGLHRIEQMHLLRSAEAVFRPMRRQCPDSFHDRRVFEFLRFHRRHVRSLETHGALLQQGGVFEGERKGGEIVSCRCQTDRALRMRRRAGLSIFPTGFFGKASTSSTCSGTFTFVR